MRKGLFLLVQKKIFLNSKGHFPQHFPQVFHRLEDVIPRPAPQLCNLKSSVENFLVNGLHDI